MIVEIYTDGSAVSQGDNKGLGGIGVVFTINDEIKKVISKGYSNTKTGRMELIAVLSALTILKKDCKAIIRSDSMYVVNSFNKMWIHNWNRTRFQTCKNGDIMEKLFREYCKFPKGCIQFCHVKGHSGDEFNELADRLANYKNFTIFTQDGQ